MNLRAQVLHEPGRCPSPISTGVIPKGWCQCGCGNKTNIIKESDFKNWRIAGQPYRFLSGHGKQRHWDKYKVDENGCWLWTGRLDPDGYAHPLQLGGRGSKMKKAMRHFYEILIGPIQTRLHLDHLCRVRKCVNPWHLEPVTSKENSRRGLNAKLTAAQAADIKRRVLSGRRGIGVILAKEYGVHKVTISAIKTGQIWAD
jgi:hypothetical protein